MPTLADRMDTDAEVIRRITRRLVAANRDRYSAAYVEDIVAEAQQALSDARVRVFLPILIERLAREKLMDTSKRPGFTTDHKGRT